MKTPKRPEVKSEEYFTGTNEAESPETPKYLSASEVNMIAEVVSDAVSDTVDQKIQEIQEIQEEYSPSLIYKKEDRYQGSMHLQEISYDGPIPLAEEIARYRDIDKDLPGRVFAYLEKNQKDAHEINLKLIEFQFEQLKNDHKEVSRGQHYGFWSALILILAGSTLIGLGHDWAGATIITTTVVALVIAFLTGRYISHKENNSTSQPQQLEETDAQADQSQAEE